MGLGIVNSPPPNDLSDKKAKFSKASNRENIKTGETFKTLFGKIAKYFDDLKAVAFSNNYNDLDNTPKTMKNPSALTIQQNGDSGTSYDGSSPKTVNITPEGIGAASNSHKHSYKDLSDTPEIPAGVVVEETLSDSTNPLQTKIIKAELEKKADAEHSHTKSDITDFPETMPPTDGSVTMSKLAQDVKSAITETGGGGGSSSLDDKAPKYHASTDTEYGKGDGSNYGHVKLSDSTDSSSGETDGVAATPAAVKAAYDLANSKLDKRFDIGGYTSLNEVIADVEFALAKDRTATFVVAASDSSARSKIGADYVCAGTADQNRINSAISALPESGGKIVFMEGTYDIASEITIDKDIVFEGMGDSTVLNVADMLALCSVAFTCVTFRDMKINANEVSQYLYNGAGGRVILDNVTLDMTVVNPSANASEAFYDVSLDAVNSRINLSGSSQFSPAGDCHCYAIVNDGGKFTNCSITLNGRAGGHIRVGRRFTTMNACDIRLISSSANNSGIVGGIGNTMTGGTLLINDGNDPHRDTYTVLAGGSYIGVYISFEYADSISSDFANHQRIIGCHLHNLTVSGDSALANMEI